MVGEHEYFIKMGAVAKVEVGIGGGVRAGQGSSRAKGGGQISVKNCAMGQRLLQPLFDTKLIFCSFASGTLLY